MSRRQQQLFAALVPAGTALPIITIVATVIDVEYGATAAVLAFGIAALGTWMIAYLMLRQENLP